LFALRFYGCFLLSINIIAVPMMIIAIMIATPKYSRVVCVATPLSGVAVGLNGFFVAHDPNACLPVN
jgi:hypothetical protein